MSWRSAVYEGRVRHRRFEPVHHEFAYRLFMLYLDLEELPRLFDRRLLWSASSPNLAWFRRRDHLGDPRTPLDVAVRNLVEQSGAPRPLGPIGLLTHLRFAGLCFNPISLYYCWDGSGDSVQTVVAEVHNTPWGERHAYVLARDAQRRATDKLRFRFGKAMHVSPFLPMDLEYDLRSSAPGDHLAVHVDGRRNGATMFDATLVLERHPVTFASLSRVLIRYPLMTAQVVGRIYWQAARLWWKGARYHPRPRGPRQSA